MSSHLKSLGIDRLSIDERFQLVEELCNNIASELDGSDVPQSHLDELARRIELHRDNPKAGSPWEEVRARLLARLENRQ